MKYEILSHPAELRLRIYGETIEELFINAVFALAQILKTDAEKIFKSSKLKTSAYGGKSQKLNTKSIDINSLLVDFLNEILARSQINKCVYLASSIKCQVLGKKAELKSELTSYPVERFDEDVKAVTCQDVDIEKRKKERGRGKGIWQTDLVLDI